MRPGAPIVPLALACLALLGPGCDRRDPAGEAGTPAASTGDASRRRYGGVLHRERPESPPEPDGWDLRSVRVSVFLDLEAFRASIQSALTLRRLTGEGGPVVCRLDEDSSVEGVVGPGGEVPFRHRDGRLSIEVVPAAPGEAIELVVFHSRSLRGSIAAGRLPSAVAWHPRRSGDAFTGEVSIVAGGDLRVAATGLAIDPRPASGGWIETRFLLAEPVLALAIAWGSREVGPFERAGVRLRGLDVSPELLGRAADAVERLTAAFGPCPTSSLAVAAVPLGDVVGEAHPGLVVVNPDRTSARVLAHLLAHAWWPAATEGDEVLARLAEHLVDEGPVEDDELVRGLRALEPAVLRGLAGAYRDSDRSVEALRAGLIH